MKVLVPELSGLKATLRSFAGLLRLTSQPDVYWTPLPELVAADWAIQTTLLAFAAATEYAAKLTDVQGNQLQPLLVMKMGGDVVRSLATAIDSLNLLMATEELWCEDAEALTGETVKLVAEEESSSPHRLLDRYGRLMDVLTVRSDADADLLLHRISPCGTVQLSLIEEAAHRRVTARAQDVWDTAPANR